VESVAKDGREHGAVAARPAFLLSTVYCEGPQQDLAIASRPDRFAHVKVPAVPFTQLADMPPGLSEVYDDGMDHSP